ncbi:hypothetical protein OUZ56_029772 [Daphnia magna]|uniref:Uncharacterized protein n=2 Tax=Daphnia magna TaxID=35525 RepID=A0ABR0B7T3_9CRUS|nr:hypothetical protein OUZ56_029772 [Daphnia magna]
MSARRVMSGVSTKRHVRARIRVGFIDLTFAMAMNYWIRKTQSWPFSRRPWFTLGFCLTLSESKNRYRARHYGIIPLGPRSGLIQWVEAVTPLFALYKRWLQRQAANTTKGKGEKAVPRPSELFYNKLTPLLEAEGLSANPLQRNQWPIDILHRVQAELMEETPKDLVAR